MGPHLHSFINLVELREYVTKELQTLHHTASKNVIYISLLVKSIEVYRYEHFFRNAVFNVAFKLRSNRSLLCNDEAHGVTRANDYLCRVQIWYNLRAFGENRI